MFFAGLALAHATMSNSVSGDCTTRSHRRRRRRRNKLWGGSGAKEQDSNDDDDDDGLMVARAWSRQQDSNGLVDWALYLYKAHFKL